MIAVFKMLRERMEEMEFTPRFNAIMTDDDRMTGPAFQEVFGAEIRHFLCHWHIRKNWRENYVKIKNNANRDDVEQHLHVMLTERSKEKFELRLKNFKSKYATLEPDFVAYFVTYYEARKELWAAAFR